MQGTQPTLPPHPLTLTFYEIYFRSAELLLKPKVLLLQQVPRVALVSLSLPHSFSVLVPHLTPASNLISLTFL